MSCKLLLCWTRYAMFSLLVGTTLTRAGSLSGRITSSSTGQALANAYIDLYDEDGRYFDYTVSGSNGYYSFSNLGSGTFYVHTDTLGYYADLWYDGIPGAADAVYFDPIKAGATPIPVAISANVTGIHFSLNPAGSISGLVTADGGAAVTNAYVDTYLQDGTRFISTLTDSSGAYTISGIPAGTYAVRTDTLGAWKDEWHDGSDAFDEQSPAEAGLSLLTVTAGGSLGGVGFQLGPGAAITGMVRNGDGSAIPGIYLDVYDTSGRRLEFDRSDTNGLYRMDGLPAGTYYLGTDTLGQYIDQWFDHVLLQDPSQPVSDGATPVVVPEAALVSGRDFVLDQGSTIEGTVFSPGSQAVEGAFVDVYLESNFFDYALTDASGQFAVPALPAGTYYVKVDTLGAWMDTWHQDRIVQHPNDPLADGADPVLLDSATSTTNLLFHLAPGASITGLLTGPGGLAVTNVYVDLYQATGQRLYFTTSDSNGVYQLGGLLEGTYYLRTDSLGRFVDEWYDNQAVLTGDDPVADQAAALVLTNQQALTGIHLALTEGAALGGTVTTVSNAPMASVDMQLYYGSLLYDLTTTDTNGFYAFSTLPAGTYYLRTDNDQERIDEWYQDVYIYRAGQPEADGATPVALADGELRTDIDFHLGLGADIMGTVRRSGGPGLPNVTVDLYDHRGAYYDFTLTGTGGSYTLELLPPGSWYIATDTFGEYEDEWYDDVLRLPLSDPIADGATPLVTTDGIALVGADFDLDLPPPPPTELRLQPDSGGQILLEWDADTQQPYQVERSISLPSGVWSNAPSAVLSVEQSYKSAAPAGIRQYRDPAPTHRAYYRVRTAE